MAQPSSSGWFVVTATSTATPSLCVRGWLVGVGTCFLLLAALLSLFLPDVSGVATLPRSRDLESTLAMGILCLLRYFDVTCLFPALGARVPRAVFELHPWLPRPAQGPAIAGAVADQVLEAAKPAPTTVCDRRRP